MSSSFGATPDPWAHLRRHTSARVALGRAGGSLPTAEVLAFAAAHAAARDVVHAPLDADRLAADLRAIGLDVVLLDSAAPDRPTYLPRPDRGRMLGEAARRALAAAPIHDAASAPDVAQIVADGLSAPAAQRHAALLLVELLPMLRASGLRCSPAYVVRYGRVAVQDEIGQAVEAKASLILIGERPGLGTPDSLGAYFVFDPRPGRTDAERNCVSNIHPGGLTFATAAGNLHYLLAESLRRRLSGVVLKDERSSFPHRHIDADE